MIEKKKTPKIRFAGFTDAWEQRKVGEIAQEVTRTVELKDDEIYQLVTVKRRNEGVVSRGVLKGKDILVKNYFAIQTGDYLISKRQIIHGANGMVPENLDNAVVSNEYLVLVSNEIITSKFWSLLSKTKEMYKMFFLSSYGVDVEKMVFNVEDWKKRTIKIPSILEQNQIVIFFDNLDNHITCHQNEYDKLLIMKKAMLGKMFPQKGRNVPEIRFKGFTDPWEQRKVGELGEVITGSTPSTNHEEYYSNYGIPWVTPTDIDRNVIYDTPRKLSHEGQKVGRVVPKDSILVTCIASIGKNTMLGTSGGFNQQINGLVPLKDKYNPYFLFVESLLWSAKMKKEAAAGTMQIVNKTQFSEIETMVPTLDEQEKIGIYFEQLDNLITLHQRKLDKLKKIKKSMLEKMFV